MRLPPNTNDEVDEDPTGNKALWDRGLLNGASQKVRTQGPQRRDTSLYGTFPMIFTEEAFFSELSAVHLAMVSVLSYMEIPKFDCTYIAFDG